METPDTSERNGYKPINTNLEDELKLQTDGEMPTGEKEKIYLETEKSSVRRSNRKCMQPNIYGGGTIYKNLLGMINKKICSVSGSNRNSLISALPKPADFQREMSPMPGTPTM